MEEKTMVLRDGTEMFYRVWRSNDTKATLHINHGMAEHSLRYDSFASFLSGKGITVYMQDHRGHGRTKKSDAEKGFFAAKDGWRLVLDDAWEIDTLAASEYPGLPHFVMGHSMGSFITRANLARHSDAYSAAIIMGTGSSQGALGAIGKVLSALRSRIHGPQFHDEFMNNTAFGSYLKKFDWKTEGVYCWLSSIKEERDKYAADSDCGFVCTSSFYGDLLSLIGEANDSEKAAAIRPDLPVLIVSGEMDPVGDYGKGVEKVASLYRGAGIRDVRLKLYRDGRHEILNDTMRDEVMADAASFLLEFV